MWQVGRILTAEECEMKRGLVHGTCPGLVEGNEYMFRIKAVNIGKLRLDSDPTNSILLHLKAFSLTLLTIYILNILFYALYFIHIKGSARENDKKSTRRSRIK